MRVVAAPEKALQIQEAITIRERISTRSTQEIFKMLPYLVTIIVLIITSMRNKRENQPPASLGLAYFREER